MPLHLLLHDLMISGFLKSMLMFSVLQFTSRKPIETAANARATAAEKRRTGAKIKTKSREVNRTIRAFGISRIDSIPE